MFSTWNRHRVLALSAALAATTVLLFVSTRVASQPNYQAMWNQAVLTNATSQGELFNLSFPDTPIPTPTSTATPTPAPTSASTLPPAVTIASMLTATEPIPISPNMSMQRYPALAYNSQDDEYLIVWWDSNIHGQIISVEESGSITFVGQDFCISNAISGEERLAVAYNSTDNEYLVVWKDGRNFDVTNWDIYAQRVSADGELIGDNFPIADEIKDQFVPAVAYNSGDNEYLIVWADLRDEVARKYDIYGQRLSGTGQLQGLNFIIASNEYWQAYPHVAYNNKRNEYLVVWQEDSQDSTSDDIYGQRVSTTGELINDAIATSTVINRQRSPAVVYNETEDEYLVVWYDYRADGEDPATLAESDIYGQRLSWEGHLLDNAGTPEDETDPTVNFAIYAGLGAIPVNEILGQLHLRA